MISANHRRQSSNTGSDLSRRQLTPTPDCLLTIRARAASSWGTGHERFLAFTHAHSPSSIGIDFFCPLHTACLRAMSQETGAPSAITCYGTHSNVPPWVCLRTKDGFCSWIPQHMFTASDPVPGSGAIRRSTMWLNPKTPDVLVIGGGNAALCAALMAREAGASVLLLESAPRAWRGGNSAHTRNLRCMHDAPQDVLVEAYPEEEYWQDLLKVTGGLTNEHLARLVIRPSSDCRGWMRSHSVHFQPPLSGALHVARTNAFFMGGGKALVNSYYRSAEKLGVQVLYESPVDRIETGNGRFIAAYVKGERIAAKACVLAAGGFESNRGWLREAWGQNERGEWPSDNFLIRGTAYNQGVLLKHLLEDHGADRIGDPTQAHMVAIDARAPLYDGGICTRIDCVSLGVVVNREGERFYDEGE